MRKYLFIIPITIIFLFASIIIYLNFFGIKTDKFNKLIYSKISQINPKLSSEINDVFIKLDIKEQTIKLETSNVKLQIAEEYLPGGETSAEGMRVLPPTARYRAAGPGAQHLCGALVKHLVI